MFDEIVDNDNNDNENHEIDNSDTDHGNTDNSHVIYIYICMLINLFIHLFIYE